MIGIEPVHKKLYRIGIQPAAQQAAEVKSNELVGLLAATEGPDNPSGEYGIDYTIVDSRLIGYAGGKYGDNISYSFRGLLDPDIRELSTAGEDTRLKQQIERELTRKSDRVALEIGGTGSRLFADFTPGFFDNTYSACIVDTRNPETIKEDTERRHHVISNANAFTGEGIDAIKKMLPNGQVDLIIERMGGPLTENPMFSNYPQNVFSLIRIASKWYDFLAEGGVMYVQIPRMLDNAIRKSHYPEWIKKNFGDSLSVTIPDTDEPGFHVLRLTKKQGAPKTLPLIGIIDFIHAYTNDPRADDNPLMVELFKRQLSPADRESLYYRLHSFWGSMLFNPKNILETPNRNKDDSTLEDKIAAAFIDARNQGRDLSAEEIEAIKKALAKEIHRWGEDSRDATMLKDIEIDLELLLSIAFGAYKNQT